MPVGLQDVWESLEMAFQTNLPLVLIAFGCSLVAFASTWALQRVALRLDRWTDVAGPQLAGNAVSNLMPAGSVIGAAVQVRMLHRKGVDLTRAVTALTIAGLLTTVAGLCVVPLLLVLPIGDTHGVDIGSATRAGLLSLAVAVTLTIAVLRGDRVMLWAGNVCHRAVRCMPRWQPPGDLAARVVSERDRVRGALQRRKRLTVAAALGHNVGDYLALYVSLLAAGLRPNPTVVLAAYLAGSVAGVIPFTPGGLGFVEVGLAGVLVLSGAPEGPALAGVAVYRLVTTWIPVVAGMGAYLLSRTRHVAVTSPVESALEPALAS